MSLQNDLYEMERRTIAQTKYRRATWKFALALFATTLFCATVGVAFAIPLSPLLVIGAWTLIPMQFILTITAWARFGIYAGDNF